MKATKRDFIWAALLLAVFVWGLVKMRDYTELTHRACCCVMGDGISWDDPCDPADCPVHGEEFEQ